ncbi:protein MICRORCHIDIA 4-like isoform X1 [Camellia sinensis]|uniref:protein MICRORCHIDIA 4-like isoform X1 n=1 Tax=Camellia sinensis TaxID=4442 RepID=UPI001035A8BB|nr:protein MICRORCHIDIA 4-like isoform X1 [Camellia sinensis]
MDVEIKKEILGVEIKKEIVEQNEFPEINRTSSPARVIDISSTDSDSNSESDDTDDSDVEGLLRKKRKLDLALPVGFLDPLPPPPEERMTIVAANKNHGLSPEESASHTKAAVANSSSPQSSAVVQSCKQFWKAGDYEGDNGIDSSSFSVGMDHVRVHPRFLHSNATSHKWALGAFAELLDNSLDEVCYGATYVRVDMLINEKDKNKMLLAEDNGGGMTPDKMRWCMSLGYSVKCKMANTIGQYGNGFKTSTMRLGADVIVFSRCPGSHGRSPTQSIGMLSYTFLRRTGKEDIVVPMIDYEREGQDWKKLTRSSLNDWSRNLETILKWSPYASEEDLLQQFNTLKEQGTRIIIYNLWEDDQGQLELDFDTDQNDIQIRGVNRDEKKIEMAKNYPNSRHFLTYRHSLRSYASILYLRIPSGFRIILRGKDIDHHNLVNDLMLTKEITYKPVAIADGMPKDPNMVAVVTIGFVKDAKYHIDIQGFNVYHKNRLIKPFWRVWNAAGSDGRGVIGVLEANFVEPAHDKQSFERTTALARLEARLVVMQKSYWSTNCQEIGYAQRRHSKKSVSPNRESIPDKRNKSSTRSNSNEHLYCNGGSKLKSTKRNEYRLAAADDASEDEIKSANHERPKRSHHKASPAHVETTQNGKSDCIAGHTHSMVDDFDGDEHASANSNAGSMSKLKEENHEPSERLEKVDRLMMVDLHHDLKSERERRRSLEIKLQDANNKIEEMDREQEALINIFSEERIRREAEEESLRNRLKNASNTIQDLLDKVKLLESKRIPSCKTER